MSDVCKSCAGVGEVVALAGFEVELRECDWCFGRGLEQKHAPTKSNSKTGREAIAAAVRAIEAVCKKENRK